MSPLLVIRYNLPKPGVITESKVCKLVSGLQMLRLGLLDLALLVCPCGFILKHEPDLCISEYRAFEYSCDELLSMVDHSGRVSIGWQSNQV